MKKILIAVCGMAAVGLSGCVAPAVSGHDFEVSCIENLQKGTTDKQEVIACMGAPTHTTMNPDGRSLLQWIYVMVSPSGSVNKHVALVFDKDGKYEYTRTVNVSQ